MAPHPDDEVLGAGGLISRLSRTGREAIICCGRIPNRERLDELNKSAHILGGTTSILTGSKAAERLDSIPAADLVAMVERELREQTPDCLLIPEPMSFHQEHRALANACLAACRPSAGSDRHRPALICTYEAPFDTWTLGGGGPASTMFVTLEERDVKAKQEAMLAHKSQVRDFPSERSVEAIEALARLRGAQSGVMFAESYVVRRWLV